MKRKLLTALLCFSLLAPMLASCSGTWEGYENADLSAYVTLGTYTGLTYTKTEVLVTDEDVMQEINTVRSDNTVRQELPDHAATKTDYVTVDYTCRIGENTVAALSASDQTFAVGSIYTLADIPGFSDSLIGRKAGESYVHTFTFPADYKNDKISDISLVAGKEATVEVTVDAVFAYTLPALDDAFVQKVSSVSKTVEEYKAEIRADLTKLAEEEAEAKMQEEIWNAALKNSTVKQYPKAELETYREEMQQYYEGYASSYGYELEEFLKTAYGYTLDLFEEKKDLFAKDQVLNDLVLYAIARAENISVTDEEYQKGLQKYFDYSAAGLGISTLEEFEQYHTKAVLVQSILWDEVIAFLCASAVGVEPSETEAQSETAQPSQTDAQSETAEPSQTDAQSETADPAQTDAQSETAVSTEAAQPTDTAAPSETAA